MKRGKRLVDFITSPPLIKEGEILINSVVIFINISKNLSNFVSFLLRVIIENLFDFVA